MSRKIIAVDIDDVILAEARFVIDYSNKQWGYSLSYDQYIEHWAEMWGEIPAEEYERRVHELHAPGVQTSYDFVDGAKEALERLAKRFDLIVLTSRRGQVRAETEAWAAKHFPGVFKELHFTGFYDNLSAKGGVLTKGDLAKEIGADYIVDDQPKHCFSAAAAGIQAILFGDYGISRHLEVPNGVTRCKDWAAVEAYFADI